MLALVVAVAVALQSAAKSPGTFAWLPAQPVDATLYPRWKDGVYSVISEESR
jgi:hypothetical protein